MKRNILLHIIVAGLLAFSLMPTAISRAASEKGNGDPAKTQDKGKALEGDVASQAGKEINQQRKKIIDEAVQALMETKNAVRALEQKKSQDALAALERATGKLNIILAREPALALAPVEVAMNVHDIYTTVDEIKRARKQAETLLEHGEVQKARVLIQDLASEMTISVVNIPLKTYPSAITAVARLIDQGKLEEAEIALLAALNTLVITDHIIPLPLVRADVKLARAEAMAQKEGRTEEDNKKLTQLLNEAREQLKLAEALGYGNKKDYKQFYADIDDIESKTKSGKSGKGFFAGLKEHLSDFRKSIFG